MAISKVILNGDTLMDVTSDTVTAEKLLTDETATKNDGTKVTGTLVAGEDVPVFTIDYGDYTEDPVITCNKTFAEMADYYIAYQKSPAIVYMLATIEPELSICAAAINKVIENESFYYVITKVEDRGIPIDELIYTSDNTIIERSTRVLQTCDVSNAGVTYPLPGELFNAVYTPTGSATPASSVSATGATVTTGTNTLTLSKSVSNTPQVTEGWISSGTAGNTSISLTASVNTRSSTDLTANGSTVTAPSGYYSSAVSKSVAAGSAFPPAVTITTNPTIGVNTSGVVTASYNGSSSITPTVNAGYVSQGTAGIISTTGTSTYQLTSQAAATYYPSTADQTIASQRWLVGAQTIKSVVTSNLTAENIVKGVVVKVGDSNNTSSITQVTGTHEPTYTATITNTGNDAKVYINHTGTKYYTLGDTFKYKEGDTCTITIQSYYATDATELLINGESIIKNTGGTTITYTYTLPAKDVDIYLYYGTDPNDYVSISESVIPTGTLSITSNASYNVYGYSKVDVNSAGEYYSAYKDYATGVSLHQSSAYINEWFSSLSRIDAYMFAGRSIIGVSSVVTFPNAQTVSYAAFGRFTGGGTVLNTTYSFPVCTHISANAFASNVEIGGINIPICSYIYSDAFYYCTYLSSVNAPNCSTIGSNAFYCCIRLDNVDFPTCEKIYNGAFYSCRSLTTISFPICELISQSAFYSCYNLTSVVFPACTTIGYSAFANCPNLTTANFSNCSTISQGAFYSCRSLTTISFPACTTIGSYAFYSCSNLTTVSFPACTIIGSYAFAYCSSLTTVSFPVCTTIETSAFASCYSLATVSFPACTSIGYYAFANCYNLLSLYLLGSSIPTLASRAAFTNTPISTYTTSTGGVYGSIYVPASLYNDYLTATNWSVYSSRFVSV